ncbi:MULTISPECIES: hypothetical protein [Bacillales]|jgi:hypothetical protein|uniref:Uncharacterized protein n=1 Tax=Caldibacillus debilis TaxID=301148 RepID=A0A150MFE9_9BACI|nr:MULTISPECIES: hypothetical protein [Bacillaceae]KYD23173.1 hypothetical protein B4135_0996 [Caldibacillus debilis]OUM91093.1 MAG: hypothetical protein BAA00_16555 [Parageobacillus thermoglucosidasius]
MLKNKVLVMIAIVGTVLLLFLLYYVIVKEGSGKEEIQLAEIEREVSQELQSLQNYIDKTAQWAENQGIDAQDIAYFHPDTEKNSKHSQDPKKEAIKYFVGSLITENVDLFISSFSVESISRDLYRVENPDKIAVAKEMMDRITRNGISKIYYEEKRGIFNTPSNKIVLTFIYNDSRQAEVSIELDNLSGDIHHDHSDESYVITTSVWQVVKQIEIGTQIS